MMFINITAQQGNLLQVLLRRHAETVRDKIPAAGLAVMLELDDQLSAGLRAEADREWNTARSVASIVEKPKEKNPRPNTATAAAQRGDDRGVDMLPVYAGLIAGTVAAYSSPSSKDDSSSFGGDL